jgi:Flp pilus assembly protein TadG
MKLRRLCELRCDRRGIAAVEFALIAPFLIAMLFGLFEVSSLVRVSLKLSHAANNLAKIVAQQQPASGQSTASVTQAQIADFCTGAGDVLAPFGATSLSAAVVSVTNNSGTNQADWEADSACTGKAAPFKTSAISIAGGGSGSGGYSLVPNPGDSVIVVQASYIYTPVLHLIFGANWTLNQTAFARPRVNSTIACSDCSS